MKVNRASLKLFRACVEKQSIREVTLFVRAAGSEGGEDYLVVTMNDVTVSSIQSTYDTKSPEDRPIDDIALVFRKIKIVYKRIKANGAHFGGAELIEHNFGKTSGK
jgi:type VI protein secretion system component Hcp